MAWTYPPEFIEALAGFGLAPTSQTPPSLLRDALNDLYRYELRRMRDQLRAGRIQKADYNGLVIATRKRYWPLSLPLPAWEEICSRDQDDEAR
jgi:hypothetical protein